MEKCTICNTRTVPVKHDTCDPCLYDRAARERTCGFCGRTFLASTRYMAIYYCSVQHAEAHATELRK